MNYTHIFFSFWPSRGFNIVFLLCVSLLHCDKKLEWASDCRTGRQTTRNNLGRNLMGCPHLFLCNNNEMYLFSTLGPGTLYQRSRFKIVILLDFNKCYIVIFIKIDFCPQHFSPVVFLLMRWSIVRIPVTGSSFYSLIVSLLMVWNRWLWSRNIA